MARISPAEKLNRIVKATRAWQTHARSSTLRRMSLAQFKEAVKPSVDAHAKVSALRDQLRDALAERDAADAQSLRLIYRIGRAVKQSPEFGDDSKLLEALGYTRESVRSRRIRWAKKKSRSKQ